MSNNKFSKVEIFFVSFAVLTGRQHHHQIIIISAPTFTSISRQGNYIFYLNQKVDMSSLSTLFGYIIPSIVFKYFRELISKKDFNMSHHCIGR